MKKESINVTIWKNRLKQGVAKEHIIQQACNHEGQLDALPHSEERDEEIRQTVAFIKSLTE